MKQIRIYTTLITILLLIASIRAQQLPLAVDDVLLVNTGEMYVDSNSDATLYLPGAVRMQGNEVNIRQDGKTVITGNFYQDANGNVFDANSTGIITFRNDQDQFITCHPSLMESFDRGLNYIAYSNIEIDNNSRVIVVPKMGINAGRITRTPGKAGVLYLQSAPENNTTDAGIYDASLRVTGTTALPAGIVVVERYVEAYRGLTNARCPLFPFATPFDQTQTAGYFAGNWLRQTLRDGDYGGTSYPMADTPDDNAKIAGNQYVVSVTEPLEPGKAYFLKLRPTGEYDIEYVVTGDAPTHEFSTYVFDGKAFNLPVVSEQLFTKSTLFEGAIPNVKPDNTVNWVIGNSYTSPLSLSKIREKMESSTLTFDPEIYVFTAGQTTFLPVNDTSGSQVPGLLDITEIPSMSVFMLQVSKEHTQNGSFSIGVSEQTHGDVTHNFKSKSRTEALPDLLLRLSLASNSRMHDKAVIGVREQAKAELDPLDRKKTYNVARETFQLYTLSKDNIRLSANAIPVEETSIPVFIDTNEPLELVLEASRLETLPHEKIWLEDKKTGEWKDLKKDPVYPFESDAKMIDRFNIHFDLNGTFISTLQESDIRIYYEGNDLVIEGISQEYIETGVAVEIIDMQGVVLMNALVRTSPEWRYTLNLNSGIYLARLSGKKNGVYKFKI